MTGKNSKKFNFVIFIKNYEFCEFSRNFFLAVSSTFEF